jgi:hypothetical protein
MSGLQRLINAGLDAARPMPESAGEPEGYEMKPNRLIAPVPRNG